MSYHIYAWLEDGNPQLKIIDTQSKPVCVLWSYRAIDDAENDDKKEIQILFKDLLLGSLTEQSYQSYLSFCS